MSGYVVLGLIVVAIVVVLVLNVGGLRYKLMDLVYGPPKYIGCYPDSPTRTFGKNAGDGVFKSVGECRNLARDNGSKYFAMQWQGNNGEMKGTANCFFDTPADNISEDKLKTLTQYQNTPISCNKEDSGFYYGGAWTNAVYQV